jgi:putative tryptophan/tyrosine transport system substrate-binding protein
VSKKILVLFLATFVLASAHLAQAQQAKVYRIGVIHEGGPYTVVVDGLKDGLKELGLTEGKHYVLEIRDLKGDRKAAEEAARSLERGKVDLIYAVATSVTIPAKRATTEVPIVFVIGGDPVVAGLVESYAKPGGRLTGVVYLSTDLTGKRLEILKEILPKLHKVVTFYDPNNEVAMRNAKSAREAARQLKVELIERHVASVEELQLALKGLHTQEADAYFHIPDAMVASQAQFIIDTARAKKLPTMFQAPSLAEHGALAGYGVSYYEIGRLSAKYVQRVLAGTSPQNLPVEMFSRLELAVNLKTARELGLTIPQSVLFRADKVTE